MPRITAPDYQSLLRRVEAVVREIDEVPHDDVPIHAIVDAIIVRLRDDLGIYGGRLYERRGEFYELRATFPDAREVESTVRVPRTYPPMELALMQGIVFMESDDPRLDRDLETRLGVEEFAAVEVGSERYVLGFNVAPGHSREAIVASLGVVRHAINQKIRQYRADEIFYQAKLIQSSILPTSVPDHPPFEIAFRTESMETVGGDLLDFVPTHDGILGLTVADASGHGLPAALQVRDVYTGLRMGLERDLKIVRTVERLNQIIHGSTLTSRFVSLLYGELERNGLFIYVNAGHPPPLHLHASTGEIDLLREGGPVLGPLACAEYDRGFARLRPGDVLVLVTDGILEAHAPLEPGFDPDYDVAEEYGSERLESLVRRNHKRSARQILDALSLDVRNFTGAAAPDDDRTALVVKYPSA